jgi:hypothetical protein
MKPDRQSTKGYAQGSDLSVDMCVSYELDGDIGHNKVLSRLGRREGVIPTSYVWFVLLCMVISVLRGPCLPYIVWGQGYKSGN